MGFAQGCLSCPQVRSIIFTISCQNCLFSHKLSPTKIRSGIYALLSSDPLFPQFGIIGTLLSISSDTSFAHILFLDHPSSLLLSLNIFEIHHLPDFNFLVFSEMIHNLHAFNFLALLTSNLLFAQFWSLGWLSSDPSFAQINFVTRFQSSFPSCLNAEKKKTYHQTVFYDFLRFFKW